MVCPLNFVKTKLKLEELQAGELLEVILDDGESIINVPRSVKEEGHQIVLVKKIDEGHYKLVVKKAS
jgi:TusA-related sulfurtransferase